MKTGRNEGLTEGWKLADQDKTLPDGWKAGVVVDGVNTPTASLRNTLEEETIDEVVVTTTIEKPVMGVEGVTTLTASLRNIVKSVPEDTAMPNGWNKSSALPDCPASGKRRVRGK